METEAVVPRPRGLRNARRRSRDAVGSHSAARVVVWCAAGTYAAVFSVAGVLHYLVFRSPRNDLGNMAQAVWSTAHGRFLESTTMSGREITRLAVHVEPFLVFLAPLWRVWGSPMMLVAVEALVVSTGALPVFWLARKHVGSDRAAAHFALAYLLFPATQFNAFEPASGFHAVSLAVPFILFAIWFLDEDRLVLFAVFALLAASTEEQIPAAVGCLGIWYAVRRGRRLIGLTTFCLGVAASLVNFLVVIPHFSPSGTNPFVGRYRQVGSTPTGMLHKVLSDPGAFVHAAATTYKLVWLLLLLLPFLGFWVREPLLLLGAAPQLVIDLLSSKPEMTSLAFHYTAGIVPFVVAASIFGVGRLRGDPGRLSLYVLAAVASTAAYSPLWVIRSDVPSLSSAVRTATIHAMNLIPSDAPVSTSNQLGSALAARHYSFVFPTVGSATWVVVNRADPTYDDAASYARALQLIESSRDWKTVYSSHGIRVLHRIAAG